ncbi:actin-associated protein FAM107A-like isoform X2 [Heliangelus exortis]|uniref:actin-associated protein FAM107A-like isoform X2 n=1 Tax=Heliangelus exortis TaxID=472823 RepID=UPI003A8F86B3
MGCSGYWDTGILEGASIWGPWMCHPETPELGTPGVVSRISPCAGMWHQVKELGGVTSPLVTLSQVGSSLVVTPSPMTPSYGDPLPLLTTALLVTPSHATATDGHRGLIQPKKVPNPVWESRSHRELHRELLFSHSRGLLPRHRAELPRVLESRRLRQLREELRGPPSDLEQQLRKRHQRLEEEQAVPVGPDPEPRPEFLLAREGLRKLPLVEPSARQT